VVLGEKKLEHKDMVYIIDNGFFLKRKKNDGVKGK